jgi:predicted CXXCH cytochrome family protein
VIAVAGVAAIFVVACDSAAKYRVLSFFFDGVPDPTRPQPPEPASVGAETGGEPSESPPKPAPMLVYAHAPYAQNRCGECHDAIGGNLARSIADGLCLDCHAEVAVGRFVHGPVAVRACDACQRYVSVLP